MALPSLSNLFISPSALDQEYDFITIGGGTAGLTIASRLSENPSYCILVLEAGSDHSTDPKVLTPGLAATMYDDPKYDWEFKTVPQKELRGRSVFHPRGKALGGSSTIYQMKIVFNSPSSWDTWSTLFPPSSHTSPSSSTTNPWNSTTMARYESKFHTFHPPSSKLQSLHESYSHTSNAPEGKEGPIHISHGNEGSWSDIDVDFYKTMKGFVHEYGWEERTFGGAKSPNSVDPRPDMKSRSWAVSGYLGAEVQARKNLKIVTEAMVEKIFLSRDEGGEVVVNGVKFSCQGKIYEVKAKKEVVLCAGAFHSPALLELSGIGGKELLDRVGVDCIIDNPSVGENLQDHAMAAVSFEAADGVQTADAVIRDPSIMAALGTMYETDKSGPMGDLFWTCAYTPSLLFSPGEKDELAKIREMTAGDEKGKEFEDTLVELMKGPDGVSCQYMLVKLQTHIVGSQNLSQIFGWGAAPREGNYLTFMASQNHPFSRGNVHIQSASPHDKPLVDPKYMSHPLDMEVMARHVQFMHKMISTSPLSKYYKQDGKRLPGGFENGREPTLDEAKDIVRDSLMSHLHPTSTCAMLPKEKGGVVDERLRVYGVRGLRVCDASIFPLAAKGNPITAVYAVAERGADLIKEDWADR